MPVRIIVILALLAGSASADVAEICPQSKTLAVRVKDLRRSFEDARQDWYRSFRAAKTETERNRLLAERVDAKTWLPRFQAIVDVDPSDTSAADALTWIVTHGGDATRLDALDALVAHHVKRRIIGRACRRLVYLTDSASERFLRTVLRRAPDVDVRGQACFALARGLARRAGLATGKDGPALRAEADRLFERILKEFSKGKGFGMKLGDHAERDLFELRHLVVGKTAPDIKGCDADGAAFKLSDYAGNVVLIDFWGDW
ncbi:MAG: hypothetical protein CMJ83_10405 [Planctomycetes bacterium]|jgi:hypothetical protein|nr:hypothetical protein [Planctomycetota bacterium]